MTDRLGVLLLSGIRHQAGYAPILAAHPRLRLVALADDPGLPDWLDSANAALANRLGLPYLRDLEAALARDDVAIVSVGSEPARHASLATRAARAGKHVLVDKPMALTLAECDTLAGAGGGIVTFVHRLFSPAIERLRALVDDGSLGLPWAIHVTWLADGGLAGGTVEDDRLVLDPALSGGGELANFLGYPAGTIRYLTGLEIRTVYATAGARFSAKHRLAGVEDFGVLSLTLDRGVLATITVGRLPAGATAGPGIFRVVLHGSHGSATIDEYRPRAVTTRDGGLTVRYGDDDDGSMAFRSLVDDFVAAIDAGRPPRCTIADGRALCAVLDAAYRSVRSGRVEEVPA